MPSAAASAIKPPSAVQIESPNPSDLLASESGRAADIIADLPLSAHTHWHVRDRCNNSDAQSPLSRSETDEATFIADGVRLCRGENQRTHRQILATARCHYAAQSARAGCCRLKIGQHC